LEQHLLLQLLLFFPQKANVTATAALAAFEQKKKNPRDSGYNDYSDYYSDCMHAAMAGYLLLRVVRVARLLRVGHGRLQRRRRRRDHGRVLLALGDRHAHDLPVTRAE
jgi:hypothetical protein